MVRSYLIVLLLGILISAHAQNDTILDDYIITNIENPPYFKGDLKSFIQQQVHYPKTALADSIEGKVFVSFMIDTAGNTVKHKVIRGIREDVNQEALRVTRLIKFERPATKRGGKPINVRFTVPVEFKLPDKGEKQK